MVQSSTIVTVLMLFATIASNSQTSAYTCSCDGEFFYYGGGAMPVFINELHYENTGADTGEFVEVAGPAGTSLVGWKIILYNGANPAAAIKYDTITLGGVIPHQGGGFGTLSFARAGIQNGGNDGLALVRSDGKVIQLLSYEGTFFAKDGPATGQTSTDIGVSESSTTPVGFSLQLRGSGNSYEQFTWQSASLSTNGTINRNQVFTEI
jgi:uncharacterized protein